MMFIGSAFMVLGGLFMIAAGMAGAEGFSAAFGSVYVVMALFYIIPAVFLWKYATRIAVFVQERSTGALASALEAQKSFWKFVGILMLIILAIYVAMFIFFILGGIISSM